MQLSMKSSTGDGSVVHQTAISTPGIIRERNSPWRTSHRCDWYILSPLPTGGVPGAPGARAVRTRSVPRTRVPRRWPGTEAHAVGCAALARFIPRGLERRRRSLSERGGPRAGVADDPPGTGWELGAVVARASRPPRPMAMSGGNVRRPESGDVRPPLAGPNW